MRLAGTAIILCAFQLQAQHWTKSPDLLSALNAPQIVPRIYPTPTLYVSRNATGTGTGLSWANAKTNLLQANAVTVVGSVIAVDGGTSGLNYTNDLTITNSITMYGSLEPGHSGPVKWEGAKDIYASNGPCSFLNMRWESASAQYHVRMRAHTTNLFEDIRVTGTTESSGGYTFVTYGVCQGIFRRCYFANTRNQSAYDNRLILIFGNYSDLQWFNCHFDIYSGSHVWLANSTSIFVNCLATYPSSGTWLTLGNSSAMSARLTNCVLLTQKSGASSGGSTPLILDHSIWSSSSVQSASDATNFDTGGVATYVVSTNIDAAHDPDFVQNTNTGFGELFIRVDDRGSISGASNAAVILNPDIKLHVVVEAGQLNPLTTNQVIGLRNLIESGNIVGSHSSTHSYYNESNVIQISATGTNPLCTVATTNLNDSTNWTGIMRVVIGPDGGRVTNEISLASTSYDTVDEVTNYWGGRSLGGGVVTCSKYSVPDPKLRSLVLNNYTDLDISSAKYLTFSNELFYRSEITESILDLESMIKFGTDRTGTSIGAIGPANGGTLSSNYACKIFATPGNFSSFGASNEIAKGSLVMAWSASGPASIYSDGRHAWHGMTNIPFNVLGISASSFGVVTDGSNDRIARSALWSSALGPRWNTAVFHGQPGLESNDDTGTRKLKTMMQKLSLGKRTAVDYFGWIRTNADFYSNSLTFVLTNSTTYEDLSKYLYKGTFLPTRHSPFTDTGTPAGELSDLRRYRIPRNRGVDMGCYERQQQ